MAYGKFSLDEARFRHHLIYANLMEQSGCIHKSNLYESLDPTEKGAISYFIGMSVLKLVIEALLGIPWLVHFSKLKVMHNIIINGKSTPDLLGLNNQGQWIICEAKGRTLQ